MYMDKKLTSRGFSYYNFKDVYENECSIQKSSNAIQDCIWIGCNDVGLKGFIPYGIPDPWQDVPVERLKNVFGFQYIVANNRMELNREQVAELLPILQKFVETGEI